MVEKLRGLPNAAKYAMVGVGGVALVLGVVSLTKAKDNA